MRINHLTKTFAIFVLVLFSLTHLTFAFSLNPITNFLGDEDSRYLFTGKELDSTNLYYYESRYYNPLFAHFTQADTVIGDVYDPLSLNRYAYARNNPVKYTDSTGHLFNLFTGAVGGLIGGFLGGVIDMVSQALDRETYSKQGMDWERVGKSTAIGAAAGGVGGLTFGLGTASVTGMGFKETMARSAAAGLTGGRAAQATSNVMYQRPITEDLFDVKDMARDTAIGAAAGSVFYGGGKVVSSFSKGGSSGRSVSTNLKSTAGISNKNLVSKNPLGMQRNLVSSDIEIVPFRKGMEFGNGRLYGNKGTAIIHENYGGFNIDYHYHPSVYAPGRQVITIPKYKNNPIDNIIFDDLTIK